MKANEDVTVVIPSNKPRVFTVELSPWLKDYRVVVVHNSMGIAPAQNMCARQVRGGVMVMVTDDLAVDPQVQQFFNIGKGEFCMLHTGAFPAGGVTVIHVNDFWRVGGFNEQLLYGSVDSEFYARAVLCGLRYKPIPQGLVKHVKHPSRASTIHKLFRVLRDRATFVAAYFRHYPVEVLKHDYLYRLMRGQLRTALLNLLFFPYTLVANKLGEWWRVMGEDPYDY